VLDHQPWSNALTVLLLTHMSRRCTRWGISGMNFRNNFQDPVAPVIQGFLNFRTLVNFDFRGDPRLREIEHHFARYTDTFGGLEGVRIHQKGVQGGCSIRGINTTPVDKNKIRGRRFDTEAGFEPPDRKWSRSTTLWSVGENGDRPQPRYVDVVPCW
jgi:hypothetical protein